MTAIRPVRVNHVNLVLEDFDDAVRHLEEVWGARFLVDMPQEHWHACLIDVGRVIFEVFVPNNFFLNTRFGPHHIGVEYQADVAEVRAAFAERGIRIARDIDVAVHAHPADCVGVAFEFWSGFFHDNEGLVGSMQPASYWRDEHPLGLTGLAGYVVRMPDVDAGRAFLTDLFGVDAADDRLQLADAWLELQPSPEGAVPGMHSTVFGVVDLDRARTWFDDHGVSLVDGSAPGRLALPAEQNLGVVFELELSRP